MSDVACAARLWSFSLCRPPVRPEALPAAKPPASETRVEIVPRIADVAAADWDACANPDPAVFNPFLAHAFLAALEEAGSVGGRTGWTPRHLVLEGRLRQRRRLRAGLSQVAQPGRVRVRPLLGRCLRPGRRRLLPQAADRRAVHAGAGPPPAGAPRSRRGRARGRARRRGRDGRGARRAVGRAHHVPHRRRMDQARPARLPAAHRPAVPLAQRGLCHLRGFPRLARLAQAQGHAQGARAGAQRRPRPSNG